MGIFLHERVKAGQIFPSPEYGEIIEETPPVFCWLASEDSNKIFEIFIYNKTGALVFTGKTELTNIVPDIVLEPGEYSWDVVCNGESRGRMPFTIAKDAKIFLRPSAEEIWNGIFDERPRQLFTKAEIPGILAKKQRELEVLKRNVAKAYEDGIPTRPNYHYDKNALPYREYFGRFRDFCDRNLVACALAYHLLGDKEAGAFAKRLFMAICDFNPEGPCSLDGEWGDEVGLSNARILPAVFDMLHELLDEKQRRYCGRVISQYAYQCERRLLELDFMKNPGSSHSGRLPAYLGEAAMTLKGEGIVDDEILLRWLTYATEIYGGIFPFYGEADGGWAEGTFYSTSYTKWYLPFFSAVERFTGKSYLDRPFYRNLPVFFMHFANPEFENHPFCDGYWCSPEDVEWPGFFAQNPLRVYGERTDNPLVRERLEKYPDPDLFLLHLLDIFLPNEPKELNKLEINNFAVFDKSGYVSMHTDVVNTENDLACLIRASKFGSCSHRHADQGSFALFYHGNAMITPSGYFGRSYGTLHHFNWTRQTCAHNVILIDSVGQPSSDFRAVAKILSYSEEGGAMSAKLDLSASYPMLKKYTRSFNMKGGSLIIEDELEADHDVAVTYPLHTMSEPRCIENTAVIERGGGRLVVTPLSGEPGSLEARDDFAVELNEGVPEEYRVTMPKQYHLTWKSPSKSSHKIVMSYELSDM